MPYDEKARTHYKTTTIRPLPADWQAGATAPALPVALAGPEQASIRLSECALPDPRIPDLGRVQSCGAVTITWRLGTTGSDDQPTRPRRCA